MTHTLKALSLVSGIAAAAALAGCTSDGQVGENGIVRFSQVVHFADTEDFTAPLASGRTLLVALQDPQVLLGVDQETKADFTMEVREDGDKVDVAWPLGFAQYAINLPDEGSYQLVGLRNGEALDQISVQVKDAKRIRFSKRFVVTTFHRDPQAPNEECIRSVTHTEGLESFVLHANQTITVFVVPVDEKDQPLLGLLPLTAKAPDLFGVNAQLVGHGASANSLTLTPIHGDRLGEPQEITVREQELEQDLKLSLHTTPEPHEIDCSAP